MIQFEQMQYSFCFSQNFKFPDHVGWPIGANYSAKYVVLETHYDNPSLGDSKLRSHTSGLRD